MIRPQTVQSAIADASPARLPVGLNPERAGAGFRQHPRYRFINWVPECP